LLLLNPEDKAVVIAFADYLTAKDDRQSKDQALSLLHDLVLNDDVVSNASLILRRAELLFHLGDHDKSQKMLQKILNPSVQPSGGDGGGGDAVSSVDPQPLDSTSVSTARSLMRTVTLFLARGALARADYVEAKTQVNLLMSPNSIDAEARTLRETIKRLSGS
jgi:hypothetical protein